MQRRTVGTGLGLGAIMLCALWATPAADPAPEASSNTEGERAPALTTERGTPSAAALTIPQVATARHDARSHGTLYEPRQRMVRVTDPMDLDGIAGAHGVTVERRPGRSGYAVLSGDPEALGALRDDPRVSQVLPHAYVTGASNQRPNQGALEHLQWYIDKLQPPIMSTAAAGFTVAVIDSGVAYETATRNGQSFTQAPSLASSPIVAPYDFVNDDPHANDDHGHGTHIASVIASKGDINGVTPGVGLMPLKVLDEHNLGTEISLIDAIYHAIDHDADVLNMSLSFGEGYQPSQAMQEALLAAHEAGIVMVAASGNAGGDYVSWPAASPLVIAVGASSIANGGFQQQATPYSNLSAAIDIVAPGGDLTVDVDGDGLVDGILAESVNPANPAEVGYWLMAGTSQAAGMTSGIAVELLRAGVNPHDIYAALQDEAAHQDHRGGIGGGYLQTEWYLGSYSHVYAREFYVSLLPYIEDAGNGQIRPAAKVTVFDDEGQLVANPHCVNVYVKFWGNQDAMQTCHSNDGSCTVRGAAVPKTDSAGNEIAHAWTVGVEGVAGWYHTVIHRPQPAITVSPELQDVVGSLQADPDTADAMIGWSWTNTPDPELGSVAEGYSVVDSGSGFASLPLGLIMTPRAVQQLGRVSAASLDANGEPVELELLELDGSGLASIPLGLRRMKLAMFDGSGLASIPLGLRADHMFGKGPTFVPLGGVGLASIPLGLTGTPVGIRLSQGGWRVDGYPAASALGTSTELAIAPSFATMMETTAVDAVQHDH